MMTWSNNWISEDESIWSILMKFKVANAITNEYFKKNYILPASPSSALFEEFFPYTLNYSLLSKHLNLDFPQQITQQIERWGLHNLNEKCLTGLISKCFRYCPKCLMLGFHSTLHQLQMFEFCPYHRQERLTKTCKNCNRVLNLDSIFSERDYYKCTCGEYFVEQQDFYCLNVKWESTSKIKFNQCLLLKDQIILHNKANVGRPSHNQYFDILNCVTKKELKNSPYKTEEPLDNTIAVYKAYLRRLRKRCKHNCLKSHYKLGRLAPLCGCCKCYLKLRYQFEEISSEWELFSKIKLKKEKKTAFLNEKTDIKFANKYNLFYYILFFDINITYQKILYYINDNIPYDEDHIVAFIISNISSETVKISVHY